MAKGAVQEQLETPEVYSIADVVKNMDPDIIDTPEDDYLSEFDNLGSEGEPFDPDWDQPKPKETAEGEEAEVEGKKKPDEEAEVEAEEEAEVEGKKKPDEEEETEVEGKKKPDEEAEVEGKKKPEEEEEEDIKTLSDVAAALETDMEGLSDSLTHEVEIDGEKKEVKLRELIDTYTGHAGHTTQVEALKNEREEFQTASTQTTEMVEAYTRGLVGMFDHIEGEAQKSLSTPEMVQLKEEDPAAYLIQTKAIEDEIGQFNNYRNVLGQQYTQFRQNQRQDVLKSEGAYLKKADPKWNNEKFQTAWKTLLNMGYSSQHLENNGDARMLLSAYELSTLREENAQLKSKIEAGAKAVKKIKKFPKLIKSGTISVSKAGKTNVKTAYAKAMKSGNTRDVVAATDKMLELM